jgi:WhiB family redox-sensing transcriptional regulator
MTTTGTRDHSGHGTSTKGGERWQHRAACRGHGELFYGPFGERGAAQHERVVAAKAICAQCPVRAECRRESTQERFGVWGGLTEEERGWERGWSKR